MKRIVTSLLVVVFASVSVMAQTKIVSQSVTAKFFSETPMENIEATSTKGNSVISTPKNQIAFVIPNKSFKFENSLMEEHFNEKYMESDKFPNASFAGTINEAVDLTVDGVYKVTVTGKLKIHGVERAVIIPGEITVAGGKLSLHSTFKVKTADYQIEIPKLVFQKIAEEIKVTVDAVYAK